MGKSDNLMRLADALKAATVNRPPATLKAVADALRARRAAGVKMSVRQRDFIALDEAEPVAHVVFGAGNAIPDHMLPPAMRNDGVRLGYARELSAKYESGEWVAPDQLAAARSLVQRDDQQHEAAQTVAMHDLEPQPAPCSGLPNSADGPATAVRPELSGHNHAVEIANAELRIEAASNCPDTESRRTA